MHFRTTLLAACCALALSACGERASDATADAASAPEATAPDSAAPAPEPAAPTPAEATTPAPAPAADGKPAAVVADCATTIEGNDLMQFDVGSIVVPASCSEFSITLKHTGQMDVKVMGHNVVVSKASDLQGIVADGMSAGPDAGYLKPDDARVVARTEMIGGGQTSTASFQVARIKDGGPYEFFCSFPGHAAMMRGTISVQ